MEESLISPMLQNPSQQDAAGDSAVPKPSNPGMPSPQIASSPSMDIPPMASPPQPLPAQQTVAPQPGAISVQRPGSLPRANNLHQQLGAGAVASSMRQPVGVYGSPAAAQMSFGGSPMQQQQLMGGMSRNGMIGHNGQLPLLPGQSAMQYTIHSQALAQQSRQKMGLISGSQFLPANSTGQQTLQGMQNMANSSGQAIQGMQNIGMIGSHLNSQIRANGPLSYGQQRFTQIKQQQILAQQGALTSPQKLPGQNLARASSIASINSQLSSLAQNGQSALVPNAISQQQWSKSLQSVTSGSGLSSYQFQQQVNRQQGFMPQLSSASPHQKAMGLSQQQHSHLVQQQHITNQLKLHHINQMQLQQQHLYQQHLQQQSPRMGGSQLQKSISLSGSQPDPSLATTPHGSSSQGTDTTNQLLGKRKIQDLVSQVDSHVQLDPEVVDILLDMADDFIDMVTTSACRLAKHRKSSTLEAKDVLLHLEKNWHLTIPGYSKDDSQSQRALPSEVHMKRLEVVRSLMGSQQSERDATNAKKIMKQSVNNPVAIGGLMRPLSSEHLALPTAASHMLNKLQHY